MSPLTLPLYTKDLSAVPRPDSPHQPLDPADVTPPVTASLHIPSHRFHVGPLASSISPNHQHKTAHSCMTPTLISRHPGSLAWTLPKNSGFIHEWGLKGSGIPSPGRRRIHTVKVLEGEHLVDPSPTWLDPVLPEFTWSHTQTLWIPLSLRPETMAFLPVHCMDVAQPDLASPIPENFQDQVRMID